MGGTVSHWYAEKARPRKTTAMLPLMEKLHSNLYTCFVCVMGLQKGPCKEGREDLKGGNGQGRKDNGVHKALKQKRALWEGR